MDTHPWLPLWWCWCVVAAMHARRVSGRFFLTVWASEPFEYSARELPNLQSLGVDNTVAKSGDVQHNQALKRVTDDKQVSQTQAGQGRRRGLVWLRAGGGWYVVAQAEVIAENEKRLVRVEEVRERLLQAMARLKLSVHDIIKEFKKGDR